MQRTFNRTMNFARLELSLGKTVGEIMKQLLCLALLVTVFISSAGASRAQSADVSGIAHAAFRVSDVEKTSLFYQKLGFLQAFAFDEDGKISQAFIKINDRQFIELYPQTLKEPKIGFMHLCFEGSDLNELHDVYRERGLHPTDVKKARAGNLLFTMVGPENQNIEYTQYLPGSLHWNDRSKHLGGDRISQHLLAVDLAMQDRGAAEKFYIDKLAFLPLNNTKNYLLLPGSSSEAIEFKSTNDHAAADIVLEVRNLRRTTKFLKKNGFTVRAERDEVFVTDPDGIPIEFTVSSHH